MGSCFCPAKFLLVGKMPSSCTTRGRRKNNNAIHIFCLLELLLKLQDYWLAHCPPSMLIHVKCHPLRRKVLMKNDGWQIRHDSFAKYGSIMHVVKWANGLMIRVIMWYKYLKIRLAHTCSVHTTLSPKWSQTPFNIPFVRLGKRKHLHWIWQV